MDYLIPIARAYRTRVRLFQAQLHRDESKFKKEQMRLVLGMKSELQRLQRRIRPMTAVVRHLMDDEQIGTEMKVRACVRVGRWGRGVGGWAVGSIGRWVRGGGRGGGGA